MRNPLAIGTALAATVLLEGCVMQSTYNKMLVQQHSIEAALRSEEIEQLKTGSATTCPARFSTARAPWT